MKTLYWHRKPGQFVFKKTGELIHGPSFTGSDREWNETLVESVEDLKRETAGGVRCLSIFGNKDLIDLLTGSVLCKQGPGFPRIFYGSAEFILIQDDKRPLGELHLWDNGSVVGKLVVLG